MDDCCTFFKAVSDKTRIGIMVLISDGEKCVTDISSHFDMTQPSISHHLKILHNAGIVKSRKEGKEVYYSLDTCCIIGCCTDFADQFKPQEK